jgi:hypothetical protein
MGECANPYKVTYDNRSTPAWISPSVVTTGLEAPNSVRRDQRNNVT